MRRWNADLNMVAVGNVLENALRFIPEGTQILINLDDDTTISVIDRAPRHL